MLFSSIRTLLVGIATVVPACSFGYLGIIKDLDTDKPISGALVIGVFGMTLPSLHNSHFRCTSIELVESNTKGVFLFNSLLPPARMTLYSPGYWEIYAERSSSSNPLPIGMSRKDPLPNNSDYVDPRDADKPTRLALRLTYAHKAAAECPSQDVHLTPLYVAVAREALASPVESDRVLGLQFCRQAAWGTEYIDQRYERGKVGRFIYTRAEATRLREIAPECVSRAALLTGMRHMLKDSSRPDALADEELLVKRAIVDDPAASQTRAIANKTPTTSRFPYPTADGMSCNIELGMHERIDEFEGRLRERSLKFRRDASKPITWYRCEDEAAVLHLAIDVTSDH